MTVSYLCLHCIQFTPCKCFKPKPEPPKPKPKGPRYEYEFLIVTQDGSDLEYFDFPNVKEAIKYWNEIEDDETAFVYIKQWDLRAGEKASHFDFEEFNIWDELPHKRAEKIRLRFTEATDQ